MERVSVAEVDSPLGLLRLASTEVGLAFVGLPGSDGRGLAGWLRTAVPDCVVDTAFAPNRMAAAQLLEYLAGKRQRFELTLDLRGTRFQRLVWDQLLAIDYGQTRTYAEVARALGQPTAWRAVGAANGANPVAIVVPCHRVVAADGIGGYAGGLETKRRLLAMERDHVEPCRDGRLL
jgi:O-6-methylguanine DNA methyltransferase